MAEGGDRGPPRPYEHPPFFGKPKPSDAKHELSTHDVGNQARLLMTCFIHDRLQSDGYLNIPQAEQLVEPGTPAGPPVEHIREVAVALRRIGDELDSDEGLQDLLSRVTPDSPKNTFFSIANEIFRDGVFNWGRVVALFYFAYKMIIKAIICGLSTLPLLRGIVEWVVQFIMDHVAKWIISRGGWEAIHEYFGATSLQVFGVVSGVILCMAFVVWQKNR